MSKEVLQFQKDCFANYVSDIRKQVPEIPNPYVYPDGNPIRPVVPVKTTQNSIMLVGAFSAVVGVEAKACSFGPPTTELRKSHTQEAAVDTVSRVLLLVTKARQRFFHHTKRAVQISTQMLNFKHLASPLTA